MEDNRPDVEKQYPKGKMGTAHELQSPIPYRFHLLDPGAMLALAGVMYEGERMGREPESWRRVSSEDHLNHAMAHIFRHLAGECSEDHLAHAMCQVMMAWAVVNRSEQEGRSGQEGRSTDGND